MRAEAKDQRGQGTAAATITSRMEPVDGGTRVRVETDMQITGPVAQFGRGVMQDVSGKLMGRFADCLAEEIADAPAAAPAAAAPAEAVATGRAGVLLPPGPAAAAAEAAARASARADGSPSRSPGSPPAADDVAAPRRTEDVLDLGAVGREALLRRTLPPAAALLVLLLILLWRRLR